MVDYEIQNLMAAWDAGTIDEDGAAILSEAVGPLSLPVIVNASEPYTLIAGGRSGMRPVGRKRDYTTTFLGCDYKNTSKATISTLIRQSARRAGVKVTIEFKTEAS